MDWTFRKSYDMTFHMRGTAENNVRLLNPLNKVLLSTELHQMFESASVCNDVSVDYVDSQAYLGI